MFKQLKSLIKNNKKLISGRFWILSSVLLLTAFLGAKQANAAGLLVPKGGGPNLTLAEHHVSVTLENGYSITEIDQIFKNPHAQDRDALYSFPVPKDAAVGEFTYWIDGNPVHAEVLKKQDARNLHEREKSQGRETALVEQDDYRTFDIEVSPVLAGQDVRIRLVYLQKQSVDHSMGRYVYPLEEGGVDEQRDAFWTRNELVSEAFSFRMKLRSAYPVDAVRVTNGQATISQIDTGEWDVLIESKQGSGTSQGSGLDDQAIEAIEAQQSPAGSVTAQPSSTAAYTLDKDIVVYWRLAENLPGAVDLVTYRDQNSSSGTFMLTLTPGVDLNPITEGRDWIFVLDTSGSMQGKFASLIEGVRRSLSAMNTADRFKIILFSNQAHDFTRGYLPADQNNIEAVLQRLDTLQAGGSTNLFDGLKAAAKSLDQDRTTAVLLVTDGVANVGPSDLTKFLKLMEPVDVRLFTAIMGNSANEPLLEGLTNHMEGFAMNVSNDDDIVGLMMQMISKVSHEAMHNLKVSIKGVRTRDITPEKFNRVYRGEQLVMFGKYSGDGTARLTINTEISGEKKQFESDVVFPKVNTDIPELERLWAYATIKAMQAQQDIVGETRDTRQGITDVALEHGLVTDYTSLIVVRDEIFAQEQIERKNAERVDREQQARQQRANSPVKSNQQDSNRPAFPSVRHSTSNGGGSLGGFLLAALLLLAGIRMGLEWFGRKE